MNEQTEHTQKIVDLERELKFRDRRINELKSEIDGLRQVVRDMEEWVKERDAYLEEFVTTFGLDLDNDGFYRNGDFIRRHQQLFDDYNALVTRQNKLVRRFNANIASVQPVGRPIAASEAQQDRVLKLHKAGRSSRWTAEEIGLSRRTVTTVIEKSDGTDRTTSKRRVRLGLEPKRNDWRQAAITNLPRRATGLRNEAKKLLKEARDGRA
jgi:lambda repressor-like predicted transcriptional regulator